MGEPSVCASSRLALGACQPRLAGRSVVDHPKRDCVHCVPLGIHKVTVFGRVTLEVMVEGPLGRVDDTKLAWAGADTDPHVAAAVVPWAGKNALALRFGRMWGGYWGEGEDEACAGPRGRERAVGVDRACGVDPWRVGMDRVLLGEGHAFRGGEGANASGRGAPSWMGCGGASTEGG